MTSALSSTWHNISEDDSLACSNRNESIHFVRTAWSKLLWWKTSVNNRAAFFKYLKKQWQHYLIYYWAQRQSSWLCLWSGRTSEGRVFRLVDSHSFSVCQSSSFALETERGLKNVEPSTKTNQRRDLVPHKDNRCSARHLFRPWCFFFFSVVRQICRDWSPAITHHLSHKTWDKPLVKNTQVQASGKDYGFSRHRGEKGTILSNWLFDWFMCSYLTPRNNYNGGNPLQTVNGTIQTRTTTPAMSVKLGCNSNITIPFP